MRNSIILTCIATALLLFTCGDTITEARPEYVYDVGEFQTYLNGRTDELVPALQQAKEAGDTAQLLNLYSEAVCDCYSRIDLDGYHDKWLQLQQEHQKKGYRDIGAISELAMSDFAPEFQTYCDAMFKTLAQTLVAYHKPQRIVDAVRNRCDFYFDSKDRFDVMEDSMKVVNADLKLE